MSRKLLLTVLASFLPALVLAQEGDSYRCTNGDQVRRVEIVYEMAGSPLPCEVRYHKDTEAPGQVQSLWRATNEAGYCEAQTRDFVAKLEGWGWQCMADEAAAGTTGGETAETAETTETAGSAE